MSKRLAQTVILAAVLALPACVGGGEPPGTRFAQVAAQLPPVPPDRTRFFFYRDYSLYNSLQRPEIALNGQPVAVAEIGGVSYRDMPPGTYVISVPRPQPEFGVPLGGPSFAVAPTGEVLAEGTDPMILVTLDRNVLDHVRRRYPGYLPVRADLYAEGWKAVTSQRITAPPD